MLRRRTVLVPAALVLAFAGSYLLSHAARDDPEPSRASQVEGLPAPTPGAVPTVALDDAPLPELKTPTPTPTATPAPTATGPTPTAGPSATATPQATAVPTPAPSIDGGGGGGGGVAGGGED